VSRTAAVLIFFCVSSAAFADEMADRRSVRSIAAEMAEVLRLRAANSVSGTYADMMKQNAREQLQDIDGNARENDPALHQIIADSMAAFDRSEGDTLRKIAERLYATVGPRGPAS
jgi:hypothetical protein